MGKKVKWALLTMLGFATGLDFEAVLYSMLLNKRR